MKKIVIAAVSLFVFLSHGFALDKVALQRHIRSALNIDSRLEIVVTDPVPSEIKGLIKVPVDIRGSRYFVFLSKDEKHYIWGQMFDLRIYPDSARAAGLHLTDVRSQGSEKAPVTIVEFTDLQCPYCHNAHAALSEKLYSTYTKDQVRWVYKHFPLEMHDWAYSASVAAECAAEQNPEAFWGMAELFFKNQDDIKQETINAKILQYSKDLKLNEEQMKACLPGEKAKAKVDADRNEGRAVGVNSTPTLFVNGRLVAGFRDFDPIKALIDEKLADVGALPSKTPVAP